MQEKIKIYLPNDIYQIILKDMELFEFYKKGGSLNRNEFLNKLITNYYEIYSLNNEKVLESIKQKLFNSDMDENAVEDMALSILYSLDFNHLELNHKRNNVTISMKPTKDTSFIFDYISDNLLNGTTLSGYLRSLISSYVHMPQDKRERILFKDNYELIDKAIQNNKKIYFVIKRYDKETRHIVSPFAIENSKEELFNAQKDKEDVEQIGFDFVFLAFTKATTKDAQQQIYEVLSQPFEMTPEEVGLMEIDVLSKNFMECWNLKTLLNFIKRVGHLVK